MVTNARGVVRLTLEGPNSLDVELTVAAIADALGNRFAIVQNTPSKGKPGLRVSGIVVGYGIGKAYPPETVPKRRKRKVSILPKAVL